MHFAKYVIHTNTKTIQLHRNAVVICDIGKLTDLQDCNQLENLRLKKVAKVWIVYRENKSENSFSTLDILLKNIELYFFNLISKCPITTFIYNKRNHDICNGYMLHPTA